MSTASSAQLTAVSRQIEQSKDLNRQLLNTIRWEVQKIKSAVERLQGLHGKIDEVHTILKRLEIHTNGIQPLSSIHRFRAQHSQTPPKSPTSEVSTQSINFDFNDEDGTSDFKPDASEYDSQEETQKVQEEEETEL